LVGGLWLPGRSGLAGCLPRPRTAVHARRMRLSWLSWRDRVAALVGLLVPFVVCLTLVPFRSGLPNTEAALVLVAAVVAVAANGHRLAGLLAAVSAAV
jgi:hypothetical protein